MKITVEFESLAEFENHFTSEGNAALSSGLQVLMASLDRQADLIIAENQKALDAIGKTYHAGQDDVGGNLHKDIEDIDDLNTTSEDTSGLIEEIVGMYQECHDENPDVTVRVLQEAVGGGELKDLKKYNRSKLKRVRARILSLWVGLVE